MYNLHNCQQCCSDVRSLNRSTISTAKHKLTSYSEFIQRDHFTIMILCVCVCFFRVYKKAADFSEHIWIQIHILFWLKTILTLTLQAIDIVVFAMRMCLVDATKATQSKMKTKPNIDERIAFQLVEPNTSQPHSVCCTYIQYAVCVSHLCTLLS